MSRVHAAFAVAIACAVVLGGYFVLRPAPVPTPKQLAKSMYAKLALEPQYEVRTEETYSTGYTTRPAATTTVDVDRTHQRMSLIGSLAVTPLRPGTSFVTAVRDHDSAYVQVKGSPILSGDAWLSTTKARFNALAEHALTSYPVLSLLEFATSMERVGTVTESGRKLTHYSAIVDLDKYRRIASTTGSGRSAIRSLDIDVFVDEDGRPVRLAQDSRYTLPSGREMRMTSTTYYSLIAHVNAYGPAPGTPATPLSDPQWAAVQQLMSEA